MAVNLGGYNTGAGVGTVFTSGTSGAELTYLDGLPTSKAAVASVEGADAAGWESGYAATGRVPPGEWADPTAFGWFVSQAAYYNLANGTD